MDGKLRDVEEATDPSTNRPYFYNTATNQSAWTLQEVVKGIEIENIQEVIDREKGRVYFVDTKTMQKAWRLTDLLSNNTRANPNVVERFDPKTCRAYFLDTITNQTAWNRSALDMGGSSQQPGTLIEPQAAPNSQTEPLAEAVPIATDPPPLH